MNRGIPRPISSLSGHEIVGWVGSEMALAEAPLKWKHPSVSYLQFTAIDVYVKAGFTFRLAAQLESGTGCHGLFLLEGFEPRLDASELHKEGSIFRTRQLHELPLGMAKVTAVKEDEDAPDAVVEFEVKIAGRNLRALAGEVYEEVDGQFRIVMPDESILVQVDGGRPNPSNERASLEA